MNVWQFLEESVVLPKCAGFSSSLTKLSLQSKGKMKQHSQVHELTKTNHEQDNKMGWIDMAHCKKKLATIVSTFCHHEIQCIWKRKSVSDGNKNILHVFFILPFKYECIDQVGICFYWIKHKRNIREAWQQIRSLNNKWDTEFAGRSGFVLRQEFGKITKFKGDEQDKHD